MLLPDAVAAARNAASRSMVLLKNDGLLRRSSPALKTAVIGPLAKNQHDMLGPWWGAGKDTDPVTVFDGINEATGGTATFAEGCKLSNTEPPHTDPEGCGPEAESAEAIAAVQAADQIVLALGESREMSGEAASRSTLDLPGRQEELSAPSGQPSRTSRSWSCCSTAARSRWRTSSATRRRCSRRGSRASRPAPRWPTSCSARSTPAASCR